MGLILATTPIITSKKTSENYDKVNTEILLQHGENSYRIGQMTNVPGTSYETNLIVAGLGLVSAQAAGNLIAAAGTFEQKARVCEAFMNIFNGLALLEQCPVQDETSVTDQVTGEQGWGVVKLGEDEQADRPAQAAGMETVAEVYDGGGLPLDAQEQLSPDLDEGYNDPEDEVLIDGMDDDITGEHKAGLEDDEPLGSGDGDALGDTDGQDEQVSLVKQEEAMPEAQVDWAVAKEIGKKPVGIFEEIGGVKYVAINKATNNNRRPSIVVMNGIRVIVYGQDLEDILNILKNNPNLKLRREDFLAEGLGARRSTDLSKGGAFRAAIRVLVTALRGDKLAKIGIGQVSSGSGRRFVYTPTNDVDEEAGPSVLEAPSEDTVDDVSEEAAPGVVDSSLEDMVDDVAENVGLNDTDAPLEGGANDLTDGDGSEPTLPEDQEVQEQDGKIRLSLTNNGLTLVRDDIDGLGVEYEGRMIKLKHGNEEFLAKLLFVLATEKTKDGTNVKRIIERFARLGEDYDEAGYKDTLHYAVNDLKAALPIDPIIDEVGPRTRVWKLGSSVLFDMPTMSKALVDFFDITGESAHRAYYNSCCS